MRWRNLNGRSVTNGDARNDQLYEVVYSIIYYKKINMKWFTVLYITRRLFGALLFDFFKTKWLYHYMYEICCKLGKLIKK